MTKKITVLPSRMTATEIYEAFEIPRNKLNMELHSPCPIDCLFETKNGIVRKKYLTRDVVDRFDCDMTDKVIADD